MSTGAELSVLMPIINAPFRLYYAYNPLRLYERPYCNDVILGQKQQSCSAELITRDMFPPGGAGDYTYSGGHPGLRIGICLPRAAQDLPPHHLHHVLRGRDKRTREQESRRAALKSGPSFRRFNPHGQAHWAEQA